MYGEEKKMKRKLTSIVFILVLCVLVLCAFVGCEKTTRTITANGR